MKIITLHKPVNIDSLFNHLQQNLNPLFKKQKQSDITFLIEKEGDTIKISEPEIYEEVLFNIVIKGRELHITRSEHYIDDVNSLTLESIMNSLFENISGKLGTDLVQEG
jgi:hypothetical protein